MMLHYLNILLLFFVLMPSYQESQPMPERALIAVNQVGYFTGAPKVAVYGRDAELTEPVAWELHSAAGEVVASGITAPGKLDRTSGDYVYAIDFSTFNTPGTYTLHVGDLVSPPFQIGVDLYARLKHDALTYFYLNRSGIELETQYAGTTWARAAGHLTDNDVTCLTGADTSGKTWEGCDYRLDGSGGWYDAGDYGKYVVNGGISTWTLVNFYEHSPQAFPDGALSIPENANGNTNGIPDILDEARWEMDFMLRMQVPAGQPLAGMVHHKLHDRRWSGVPVMPPTEFNNDDPTNGRFLMPPSTAATLNLAATAAQCARVWQAFDAAFSDVCLTAAETAWSAAIANPSMLYGSIPGEGGGDYGDGNVADEFYWAAAELYITTGKDVYRDYVLNSPYFKDFSRGLGISWGSTGALGSISLAMLSNGLPETEITRLRDQLVKAADRYLATSGREGYRAPITANDYVWGSSSVVLNNAIILALANDFTADKRYLNGVITAIDYLLGSNAVNQSYVSGYGTITMQHPHHRFWGNQPDYPPPPPGAIAGGPNASPSDPHAIDTIGKLPIARRYIDHIDSYSTNEVAINWNAPLVWVAAYLDEQFNQ
jgi:endoglucanase